MAVKVQYPNIDTTEFIRGETLNQFVQKANQRQCNQAGETIYEFTFGSLFKHGLFQADSHPGNYLFQKNKVVFLDFGCVKHYPEEFIQTIRKLARAMMELDRKNVDRMMLESGLVGNSKQFDFDYNYEMMQDIYRPILSETFQYTDDYVRRTWHKTITHHPNKNKISVPKDWILTQRLQWGMASIMAA